jgi:hypothetical protein
LTRPAWTHALPAAVRATATGEAAALAFVTAVVLLFSMYRQLLGAAI